MRAVPVIRRQGGASGYLQVPRDKRRSAEGLLRRRERPSQRRWWEQIWDRVVRATWAERAVGMMALNFWKNLIRQNGDKRNEREGMQISVTQNLDILRRRLLKEIALRQRQRQQKELMLKNKGILGNIGK